MYCMKHRMSTPTQINYHGDTFSIPAWMQAKAGKEGLTRGDIEKIPGINIPKDEEVFANTPEGNKIITDSEPQRIENGQSLGSVARFTAAGHQVNVRRVNEELRRLENAFPNAVSWTPDLRHVSILGFVLPPKCRVMSNGREFSATNVLLVVPESYGHGVPLKESYVNPGLRCLHDGRWTEPPHYFDEAKKFYRSEGTREKGWRYMCIEFTKWRPEDSFFTYLKALYLFLSDPWKYPHQH